jgi:hypothetical protein
MIYVEVPHKIEVNKKSIFLAGGITGCPDWQKKVVEKIKDLDIVIYNPRRADFDVSDPNDSKVQIEWEHEMLKKADVISFWFCKETIQPITLYELGAHTVTSKPLIIGMDKGYERREDVEIQTKLERPDTEFVYSLKDLSDKIFRLFNEILFIS